ncbi:Rho termination factor N-terminal domain-containing protein, partial [Pontiella sp.]|uniref:Rho termination factor N-terminal domain-containing protein n=1 Tax=Pontiella sp. TaxID=2837462 RepID=UPI0035638A3B
MSEENEFVDKAASGAESTEAPAAKKVTKKKASKKKAAAKKDVGAGAPAPAGESPESAPAPAAPAAAAPDQNNNNINNNDGGGQGRPQQQHQQPRNDRFGGKNNKKNRNKNKQPQQRWNEDPPPNTENLPPFSLHEMQVTAINDIKALAEQYGLQDYAGLAKHQLIFELLKNHGRRGGPLQGRGVLEVLPDGFGFLRSPLNSYQPAPDDIYVSPSQIRRFGVRTGDSVEGSNRAPKEKERFFALHRVDRINGEDPEMARKRVPFENL